MADFTFLTTLQTFLKTNLTITPDTARPKVLLMSEGDNDDAGGNTNSGRIVLEEITKYMEERTSAGFVKETVFVKCNFVMPVAGTSTYAEFIDVCEDIQQQFRENNATAGNTRYYLDFRMPANNKMGQFFFNVKIEKFMVSVAT